VLQVHHLPNERASSSAQWYNIFYKQNLLKYLKETLNQFLFVVALILMQTTAQLLKVIAFKNIIFLYFQNFDELPFFSLFNRGMSQITNQIKQNFQLAVSAFGK
jgi:hypothetical protein